MKSDISIIVKAYGQKFSINCAELPNEKYRVKLGRSLSEKRPMATLTEIFDITRRWAVKQRTKS